MNKPKLNIIAKFATNKRRLSAALKKKITYTVKALWIRLFVSFLCGVLVSALVLGLIGWPTSTPETESAAGTAFTGQSVNAPTPEPIVSYGVVFGVTNLEGDIMTGILDDTHYCTCKETD